MNLTNLVLLLINNIYIVEYYNIIATIMSDLDKLQLTRDEMSKLEEALKKEEFRKLLAEYAEEISDPANRKRNEEEITQLEKERGYNVKFVNPESGFVVKTSRKTGDDFTKAFINIATSPEIVEATQETTSSSASGKIGNNWSIPYSLSPPRDDIDSKKQKCIIYDCIYHPNTYKRAIGSKAFKETLITNAIDGIEREFNVTLDRNYKLPKSKYKGTPSSTLIREKNEKRAEQFEINKKTDPVQKLIGYPPIEKMKLTEVDPSIPKHSLKYRGYIDLKDYTDAPEVTHSLPKEIIVTIELPKLKSAGNIELDIQTRQLALSHNNPKYGLKLKLSYDVDIDQTLAKFDIDTKQLEVVLPIKHRKRDMPPPREIPKTIPLEVDITDDTKIRQNSHVNNINSSSNSNPDRTFDNMTSLGETTSLDTPSLLADSEVNSTCPLNTTPTLTIDTDARLIVTTNNTNTSLLKDQDDSDDLGSEDGHSNGISSSEQTLITEVDVEDTTSINTTEDYNICDNLPNYKHRQTDTYVQFVFLVQDISPQSITVVFRQNEVEIKYVSAAEPQDIYIVFPLTQQINCNKSLYQITPSSLILTVMKLNAGSWEFFKIGTQVGQVSDENFLTKNSLIEEMKTRNDPWEGECEKPSEVKINSAENPVKLTATFDKASRDNSHSESEKLTNEVPDNENHKEALISNEKLKQPPKLTNTLIYQLDD